MQFDSCAYSDAPAHLDHVSCGPWRPRGLSQAWEIPFCCGGRCINLPRVPQAGPQAFAVEGAGVPPAKLPGWKLGGSAALSPSASLLPLCRQSHCGVLGSLNVGLWQGQRGLSLDFKHEARQRFGDVPDLNVSNLRFIFVWGLCRCKTAACMQGVVGWKPLLERGF